MAQEVGLFLTFTPEFDGERERMYGLTVTADEGATKVDTLDAKTLAVKPANLADVVAATRQYTCASSIRR